MENVLFYIIYEFITERTRRAFIPIALIIDCIANRIFKAPRMQSQQFWPEAVQTQKTAHTVRDTLVGNFS